MAYVIASRPWPVELISVLIWPVTILAVLVALTFSKRTQESLGKLLGRFRHVKTPWFELELTEESAAQAREITVDGFREYRRKVAAEYDRQVAVFAIGERHQHLILGHITAALAPPPAGPRVSFRCTLHVADVLFTATMYQLVDYFPRGGGHGRTFPIRFGIVGRAWRLDTPLIDSYVSTDPNDLVRDWGMTFQEATAAGQGRRSFAAVPLSDAGGARVGLVYLDSEMEGAFGSADGAHEPDARARKLIDAIRLGARETLLEQKLIEMMSEMRKRGPAIPLHEVGE